MESHVQPETPKHVSTSEEVEKGKNVAPSRQLMDEQLLTDSSNPSSSEEEQLRTFAGEAGSEGSKAPQTISIPHSVDAPRFPDPSKHSRSGFWKVRNSAGKASTERSKAPFGLGTGISVPEKGGDLEGIPFSEYIRAPPIAESFMASQSSASFPYPSQVVAAPIPARKPKLGSPIQFPSAEDFDLLKEERRGKIRKSLEKLRLEKANKQASMRQTGYYVTPKRMDSEQSAHESSSSGVKLPSEPVGGHHPVEAFDEVNSSAGDVALQEPLGLKNNNLEDRIFLNELNTKLLHATLSRTIESLEAIESLEGIKPAEDNPSAQPDLESELEVKLKPTENFGRPFGAPFMWKPN